MDEEQGVPNPKRQQAQAHALGAGVSKRLAQEYRGAVTEAESRVATLARLAQERRDAGLPVPPSWALEQGHYEAMRDQMNAQLARLNQTANGEITQAKRDAVDLAQKHAEDWIGTGFRQLPASAVEEMVRQIHNARPGTPFGKALGQYPREVNKKMESILVQSVALGLGPRETVKLFRAQMAGPFRQYDNLARTEIMGAYTRSSIASYRENREHLDGWEWVVEPGGNLCPFCREKDGKVFPVTENFSSHPSCRCTTIPKVKAKFEPTPPPVPPKVEPTPPPKPGFSKTDSTGRPVREKGETQQEFAKRLAAYFRTNPAATVPKNARVGFERAIPSEIRELRRRIGALNVSTQFERDAERRREAHKMLQVAPDRRAILDIKKGPMTGVRDYIQDHIMGRAEEARRWLNQHVDRSVLENRTVRVNFEQDRAYYRGGGIYMSQSNGVRTYVHEMGHWIEDLNEDILEQSELFLRRRADGAAQLLSDLTGQSAYGRSEIAYPDKFIDPYVGKIYTGASEVISMGMEEMYRDPVGFANRDPEHFELTLAAMHGTTKTNTTRR